MVYLNKRTGSEVFFLFYINISYSLNTKGYIKKDYIKREERSVVGSLSANRLKARVRRIEQVKLSQSHLLMLRSHNGEDTKIILQ